MNTKMGLFGVGLVIVAGALTVSCGGSDGGDDSNTSGTSPGGSSTAGSSTAGTSNNTGGTSNNTGGTSNNTGGTTNNGGRNNTGGDNGFPGFGGDNGRPGGDLEACDAAVMNGEACEQGDQPCEAANGETCLCGGQGGSQEWTCIDTDFGDGGAGPGLPMVDCGATPMTGADCDGLGLCEGSDSCACYQGNVICVMP